LTPLFTISHDDDDDDDHGVATLHGRLHEEEFCWAYDFLIQLCLRLEDADHGSASHLILIVVVPILQMKTLKWMDKDTHAKYSWEYQHFLSFFPGLNGILHILWR